MDNGRSGIVFAAVSPHPPLLIPQVGRDQIEIVRMTQDAMRTLGSDIKKLSPDVLVFVSPHSVVLGDSVAIMGGDSLRGNFGDFGARDVSFDVKCDQEMIQKTQEMAQDLGILTVVIDGKDRSRLSLYRKLDHGIMVPLYYIEEAGVDVPIMLAGASFLPLEEIYAFGMAVSQAARHLGRRAAFIASGDLSHRLTYDAPAGYSERGIEFDRLILRLLEETNVEDIIHMDPDLVESAGECGYRPIIAMLGALDGFDLSAKVLSYEGPFGVGYGVVEVWPGEENPRREFLTKLMDFRRRFVLERRRSESPLVTLARQAVEEYVIHRRVIDPPENLTPEMRKRAGVFCSIKKHGQLRGCIGTISPVSRNVATEVIRNAIAAATEDPRFMPVRSEELDDLVYSVDVLSEPEPIRGLEQLDPKRYGVIVRKGGRSGLLLPDLEGISDPAEQVAIAKRKAGIRPEEEVSLERFEVVRYL
ncbi:MAG TPA: AmmeMemoRadiSam system protein A [Firmicutes bacterium]|nr:AmmeMemoRadiSam system protein A [Bacillota bacterium]HHY98438.1 AmmeMemoRadiSam system protein A [Bacillota bacterium]